MLIRGRKTPQATLLNSEHKSIYLLYERSADPVDQSPLRQTYWNTKTMGKKKKIMIVTAETGETRGSEDKQGNKRKPQGLEVKGRAFRSGSSPSGPHHLCHDSSDVTPRGDGTN